MEVIKALALSPSETLLNRCLYVIANSFSKTEKESYLNLPKNLKNKILKVLTKRGLINDNNIDFFINDETKILDLSECQDLTDVGLQKLKAAKYLVKIDLNSNATERRDITSKGISSLLQSCAYLQVILLRRCVNIDDTCLEAISRTCGSRLVQLNISNCPLITDRGLMYIGQSCKMLRAVNLSGLQITDQGVFNLMSVNVGNTVEEIHITQCKLITDQSIEAILVNSKKVKFLMFHSCPKVTDASRVALEHYMTNSNKKFQHLTWTIY